MRMNTMPYAPFRPEPPPVESSSSHHLALILAVQLGHSPHQIQPTFQALPELPWPRVIGVSQLPSPAEVAEDQHSLLPFGRETAIRLKERRIADGRLAKTGRSAFRV